MRFVAANISFAGRFYAPGPALSTTKRVSRGALRGLALALLLGFSLPGSPASAQSQSQLEHEISRVESWFMGKSLNEIKLKLGAMRPAAVSQADKELLMSELPLITSANRIRDQYQLEHLRARALPVLKFYQRDGIVELIVFKDARPIVYSKPGVMIAISTEVLKIVGSDDAALAGIIAHESAHEYVAMQFLNAVEAHDLEKLRELELFCDAVAVVVLLDLGLDPSHFAQIVKRTANYSTPAAILNNGSNSHPAVGARLRLILDITVALKASPTDSLKSKQKESALPKKPENPTHGSA